MTSILLAAMLCAAPPARQGSMVRFTPAFEVIAWEPATRSKLDAAQTKWVTAYEALLARNELGRKPDSLLFEKLEQKLVPVQIVRASGWSDGGHRQLEPMLFLVGGASLRVIRPHSENLDDDGYRQRFTDFRACLPELFPRLHALFDKPGGHFEADYEALQKELCEPLPLRASLDAAKKAGQVKAAFVKDLVVFLALLAESAGNARIVASAGEVTDSKLTTLLKGTKTQNARWVAGPAPISPLVVTPASLSATGTLLLDESAQTTWLKGFELKADGEIELTLSALAHSVTFIE